jgi:hypothetical protein
MLVFARKDISSSNFTAQSGLKRCRVNTLMFINMSQAFLVFVHRYSQARLANMLEIMFVQLLIQDEGLQGILYSITVYTSLDVTLVKTFNNLCETLKQSMWLIFCVFLQYAVSSHEKIVHIFYCILPLY